MRILLVDDDDGMREGGKRVFEEEGWKVITAESEKKALDIIYTLPPFDVAVIDMCLRDDDIKGDGGMKVISKLKEKDFFTEVIAVTGYMGVREVVENIYETMKFGIYQFLSKTNDFFEKLLLEIKNAIAHREKMIEMVLGKKKVVFLHNIPSNQRQKERDKALREGLIKYEMISQNTLDDVLREKESTKEGLETILIKKGIVSEGRIAWILSKMFNIDFAYICNSDITIEK